jgi:hypothetical protein
MLLFKLMIPKLKQPRIVDYEFDYDFLGLTVVFSFLGFEEVLVPHELDLREVVTNH